MGNRERTLLWYCEKVRWYWRGVLSSFKTILAKFIHLNWLSFVWSVSILSEVYCENFLRFIENHFFVKLCRILAKSSGKIDKVLLVNDKLFEKLSGSRKTFILLPFFPGCDKNSWLPSCFRYLCAIVINFNATPKKPTDALSWSRSLREI